MARDIEEFLRRAAERRKKQQQQQKQGGGRPPAAKPPQRQQPAQRRQPQPPAQPRRQPPKPQRPRTLVDDREIKFVSPKTQQKHDMRNESVQEHVKHYINTQDIADHAEHLGERLSQTDERVDERIHKTFDHSIGKLGRKPSVTDSITESTGDDVSPIAQDLLELLSKPKTIRQAILVSEILRRPDFEE